MISLSATNLRPVPITNSYLFLEVVLSDGRTEKYPIINSGKKTLKQSQQEEALFGPTRAWRRILGAGAMDTSGKDWKAPRKAVHALDRTPRGGSAER
jgi:hypothetical protein